MKQRVVGTNHGSLEDLTIAQLWRRWTLRRTAPVKLSSSFPGLHFKSPEILSGFFWVNTALG
jgi:hypothetical protein